MKAQVMVHQENRKNLAGSTIQASVRTDSVANSITDVEFATSLVMVPTSVERPKVTITMERNMGVTHSNSL